MDMGEEALRRGCQPLTNKFGLCAKGESPLGGPRKSINLTPVDVHQINDAKKQVFCRKEVSGPNHQTNQKMDQKNNSKNNNGTHRDGERRENVG